MTPQILHIDTATEHASICLSQGDIILGLMESGDQKNHGAFLQPAIQELMQPTGHSLKSLDAISVTGGPGSYTGLRVGMASAKGLCYALEKPLITINTLLVIALSAKQWILETGGEISDNTLFCPMIDARRMEVFTATYSQALQQIEPTYAKILYETSFMALLSTHRLVFSGSGAKKFQPILTHTNATFIGVQHTAKHLVTLASEAFQQQNFANLAYSEPIYGKAFYTPLPKK